MDIPSENLASVDSSWLRMDEPGNLMVVNAVIALEDPIPFERFRELIATRLVDAVPRMRQRIAYSAIPLTPPRWEPDPYFDLANHVKLAPLQHADQASLQALAGRVMSEPFDPARPLWRYYFVPDYEGGCATIARYHHCIGDGLALLYLLLKMTDAPPADPAIERAGEANWATSVWNAITWPISRGLSLTRSVEESVVHEVRELLANPARALDLTRDVATNAGAVWKLLAMSSDPQTVFKGPLTTDKRAVWSRPVPIATIKDVARATGSTINDVVLACVAGGLRAYLQSRDQPVADVNVRAVVPVNLRPVEQAAELGNRFGLVFVSLPLGIDEPLDRVFEVRKRMQAIKHSPEALLTFQILRTLGVTPSPLFELVVTLFGMRATAVMTNVIGPREHLRVNGTRLKQVMFWVPCSGHLGMGVSIFSYAGNVWLGIATDGSLVPNPEKIVDLFEYEMSTLVDLAAQVSRAEPKRESVAEEKGKVEGERGNETPGVIS